MSSTRGFRGRLDAAAGRDVVYCHSCDNEWYHDEYPHLVCERCGSDVTEIVDPQNDPRPGSGPHDQAEDDLYSALRDEGPGSRMSPFGREHDSDPDEADIEEHVATGPGGFFLHRTVYRSPSMPPGQEGPRPDPNAGEVILRRFTDMVMNELAAPQGAPSPNRERQGQTNAFDSPSSPESPARTPFDMPRIQTRTFRAGPLTGSTTTFTITRGRPEVADRNMSDFDLIFRRTLDQELLPGSGSGGTSFTTGLQELLQSLLNPAAAVHGDAVYSQEALDRIITNLMEANPQSNAAPPASQMAIDRLERKRVDAEMLGPEGKAECTICIDELHKGDEVAVLPCKHWFHRDCVTLWLKEHNTCPICRAPIESNDRQTGNRGASTAPFASTAAATSPSSPSGRGSWQDAARLASIRSLADYPESRHYSVPEDTSRTGVRSPSISRVPSESSSTLGPSSPRDQDTSHGGGNRDSQSSNHGPLGWLRNPFSRDSRGGSGNERRRSHREN